ncbi:sucrase ferredoxin [soil metagenome]
MYGTGSRVRNWLLIEQNGAWGHDAVSESDLDPGVAAELKRKAARHRIRLLLIRRPGRPEGSGHECYAAHSGVEDQWVQRCRVDDLAELLDIDLACVRGGTRPEMGRPWDKPLYLVCTNGSHDPCCERYGGPVARALALDRADETWECSHVGGDRFAANLVCLPHGLYFGRVQPEDAAEVASLYENGLVHLDHYRGRSCFEPIVQAADIFIRVATGMAGIDDLIPESRRDQGAGRSTLGFRDHLGARHEISVAAHRGDLRPITCNAAHPGAPREYELVSLSSDETAGIRPIGDG